MRGSGPLLVVVPALSHHAASVAYHVDKEITVRGVVTEVKWGKSPHVGLSRRQG